MRAPLKLSPVAQSVERWTPCGESTRPSEKDAGFEARRTLDVFEPPGGYRYGWWQAVARRSQLGRARLCAYVKHLILNSVIEQELRDRRVEDRTNATSSA